MSEEILETDAPKKKSFLRKLVSWTITIVVVLVFANLIAGLRSDQKEKFVSGVRTKAEQHCNGDAACLGALNSKFSQCLEDNSESHKSGKFSRKYTLDEQGLYACLR